MGYKYVAPDGAEDVAAAFPDAKTVNETLRLLIKLAQTQTSGER